MFLTTCFTRLLLQAICTNGRNTLFFLCTGQILKVLQTAEEYESHISDDKSSALMK